MELNMIDAAKKQWQKAVADYELLRDDEDVQRLLHVESLVGRPSLFTHRLVDLVRDLNLTKQFETNEDTPQSRMLKEDTRLETIEKEKKIKKVTRRSTRITKKHSIAVSRVTSLKKHQTFSKIKLHSKGSQSSNRSNLSSKRSKQKTSSDGSSVSSDLIHILTVTLSQKIQRELKCEIGVDIFMEMPWKIISKTDLIKSIKEDFRRSPFSEYLTAIENYPEEEILVGRTSIYDPDTFYVAITKHARNFLLEEIKTEHLHKWGKVMNLSNFPVGVWNTLGSENEIENEIIKNSRPLLSYDCLIKKKYHEEFYNTGYSHVDFYTDIKDRGTIMSKNIEGIVFHKYAQAHPLKVHAFAQTIPEIPVNSATQFTVEMRVEENKETLENMELDYNLLNNKLNDCFFKIDSLLTFNEEYDLFRDDYEILATEGGLINMYPNIPYEYYATMITFVGTRGKGINSTSWHPSTPGLIAVAYGKQHIARMDDLNYDSDADESVDNDSDEETMFQDYKLSNEFDEYVENLWNEQINELESDIKAQTWDTHNYDLAVSSIEYLEQAKNIRTFQILQDKKRIFETADDEDLYQEEKFEYPLFDEIKKRQKKCKEKNETIEDIIDKVMNEEPKYLTRENLFSGNFHWKLKFADDLINPMDLLLMQRKGSVPKKYMRTFLFREFWCGDFWNFGDDLKYSAIEINKEFRESAVFSLGLPSIPEKKIFLPGFKIIDDVDYTLELSPWQWFDALLEHSKYLEKNKIKTPTVEGEDNDQFLETDNEDNEPFDFLFARNVPMLDIEYEDINIQYNLCDSLECEQCQFFKNNVLTNEGKEFVSLKFIMNKENSSEVEQVIVLPYKHVKGTFEKKEERLILQKKKYSQLTKDENNGEITKKSKEAEDVNGLLNQVNSEKEVDENNRSEKEHELSKEIVENNEEELNKNNEEEIKQQLNHNIDESNPEEINKEAEKLPSNIGENVEEAADKNSKTDQRESHSQSVSETIANGSGKSEEIDDENINENMEDDELKKEEFELPYCSPENGCLIRRLLPDYLQDSRTRKLFCDQCNNTEEASVNNDINDGQNAEIGESKSSVIDVIEDSDIAGTYLTESLRDEEPEDEVGYFLLGDDTNKQKNDFKTKLTSFLNEKKNYINTALVDEAEENINNIKNIANKKICSEEDNFKTWYEYFINQEPSGSENINYENKENIFQLISDKKSNKISSSSSSITFKTAAGSFEDNNVDLKTTKKQTIQDKYSSDLKEEEEITLDIKHILDDPNDDTRDFSEDTKKIINEELDKLKKGYRTKIIKRPFEVISSCESSNEFIEKSEDDEHLDKLNQVHHVAIWSIANEIKPMKRLTSPFEITCISFCPHNGRLLVGGTTNGQIVLWDLENELEEPMPRPFHERSDFDLLGLKHLERVMNWYKRLRPENRIYITAISNITYSHLDRVVDITWLPPNTKVNPSSGKFENFDPKGEFSLQFMSTSADGILKFWDLKSPALPTSEPPINKDAFQPLGQFKLPDSLQTSESKYSKLFLRWDPIFQIRFELKDPQIKKLHITSMSHDQITYNYEQLITGLSESGKNVELQQIFQLGSFSTDTMNNEALLGSVDGLIFLYSWKDLPIESIDQKLIQEEGLGAILIRRYKPVHDGPISCIARHPMKNEVFITAGGHVFSLWNTKQEDPLKWKRYSEYFVTAVSWTQARPSSFIIGRSDGSMELWDLYELANEPKMVLKIASGPIHDFTLPCLPVPRSLFGIIDDKGILKFYSVPWEYLISRPNEAEQFFERIEAEYSRKTELKKKGDDYLNETEVLTAIERNESEIDWRKKSEEMIKKKDIVGCKKFKEELYKWYLRRRGKNAAWLDEAEKNWYLKEEEYMIKSILKTKKINMNELNKAIAPLYGKEKYETELGIKVLDILERADEIFRSSVQELALMRDFANKSQVALEVENINLGDLQNIFEEIEIYFGESYDLAEEELEAFVKSNSFNKEWTFVELCEKNQPIRDFWNDRRRFIKPENQWAHELLAEELKKAGYQLTYYMNHEESYIRKKYKRRLENIEELKKKYGDDYDPFWDLQDKYKTRNTGDKPINETSENIEDIFSSEIQKIELPHRGVEVVLPKGSFYRKYMTGDKNMKWEKPITYEEREFSRSKMYKDRLGESEMTVTSEPSTITSLQSDSVEPLYEVEDEGSNNGLALLRKDRKESNVKESNIKSDKSEKSSSTTEESGENENSSSTTEESGENKNQELSDETREKSKSSVRFKEQKPTTGKESATKKTKKDIDFEKEDITGRFQTIDDIKELIKEKKMRGEEIIDIDDLSGSYESLCDSFSSSCPSPDMSLKSEDLESDNWSIDDSDDEYFKEMYKQYLGEITPRYEAPKIIPHDDSSVIEEPTEEWFEDDLKPMFAQKEQEGDEDEESEDGDKKKDFKALAILEKEIAIRDKIEKLEEMGESENVVHHAPPPGDSSEPKIERIKHPFCEDYNQDFGEPD